MDEYENLREDLREDVEWYYYPDRAEPQIVPTEIEDGQIITEPPLDDLKWEVRRSEVLVLKDVFEPDKLREIRKRVFEWGQETDEQRTKMRDADKSFHYRWQNDVDSLTGRGPDYWMYHNYTFIFEQNRMPEDLYEMMYPICEKLRVLQNALAGTEVDFLCKNDEATLRPQINQYPSGGGYFGLHTHSYKPQHIGLILSLSERGTDYDRGGTRFAIQRGSHGVVDVEKCHDIGDITVFRYDVPHEVLPTDPGEELDWNSQRGRWNLILPYLPPYSEE